MHYELFDDYREASLPDFYEHYEGDEIRGVIGRSLEAVTGNPETTLWRLAEVGLALGVQFKFSFRGRGNNS